MKRLTTATLLLSLLTFSAAQAGVVAFDMVNSDSQNLISHTNAWENAFSSAGDGFQKYQRGVSPTIPFAVLDDSISVFPPDTLGIIDETNTDVFFGATDTVNGDSPGLVSANWLFDVSGITDLSVSIDIGAMGDFETSDFFEWTYSIDGGATMSLFSSTVDNDGSQVYTMAGGAVVPLNDPMLLNGVLLSNILQTFTANIAGTGSELLLTLTVETNGGSEGMVFQNLVVNSEPGMLLLLGAGLLGLGFARRRA